MQSYIYKYTRTGIFDNTITVLTKPYSCEYTLDANFYCVEPPWKKFHQKNAYLAKFALKTAWYY